MKLARPNVFHPRIVLASCRQLPGGDGDDDGVVAALRGRGLNARWLPWDDPETESADLVILRAAWDYADRRDEFLAWTTRVRNLLNAPAVVAWNSDKHYLRDLAAAGVPVATVSIGGARNAGLLAVRILGSADPVLRARMAAFQADLEAQVLAKDRALRERLLGE